MVLASIVNYFTSDAVPATLLWGVFLRVYASMAILACAMLIPQMKAYAGKSGIAPIQV
jgi:hypothetical protein